MKFLNTFLNLVECSLIFVILFGLLSFLMLPIMFINPLLGNIIVVVNAILTGAFAFMDFID